MSAFHEGLAHHRKVGIAGQLAGRIRDEDKAPSIVQCLFKPGEQNIALRAGHGSCLFRHINLTHVQETLAPAGR
jgi:hypothetical protein